MTTVPHDETLQQVVAKAATTAVNLTLQERVQALADARRSLEAQQAVLKAAAAKFDEENRAALETLSQLRAVTAQLEHDVRTLATIDYERTENKAPCPGVGIRLTTELEYEPAKALQWAKDTKLCLALDVKAFEKVAATNDLEFVQIKKVPTATIARDLDAVLGAAALVQETGAAVAQDGAR